MFRNKRSIFKIYNNNNNNNNNANNCNNKKKFLNASVLVFIEVKCRQQGKAGRSMTSWSE